MEVWREGNCMYTLMSRYHHSLQARGPLPLVELYHSYFIGDLGISLSASH